MPIGSGLLSTFAAGILLCIDRCWTSHKLARFRFLADSLAIAAATRSNQTATFHAGVRTHKLQLRKFCNPVGSSRLASKYPLSFEIPTF
jgi:hypothetical protein